MALHTKAVMRISDRYLGFWLWESDKGVPGPIIESVMLSTGDPQGI